MVRPCGKRENAYYIRLERSGAAEAAPQQEGLGIHPMQKAAPQYF